MSKSPSYGPNACATGEGGPERARNGSALSLGQSRPGARRKRIGEAKASKYVSGVRKSFERMFSKRVGSGGEDEIEELCFRLVLKLFALFSSTCSSRPTQSTIGSETARAWTALGSVRARVVAKRPPMCEP